MTTLNEADEPCAMCYHAKAAHDGSHKSCCHQVTTYYGTVKRCRCCGFVTRARAVALFGGGKVTVNGGGSL